MHTYMIRRLKLKETHASKCQHISSVDKRVQQEKKPDMLLIGFLYKHTQESPQAKPCTGKIIGFQLLFE